MRCQKPDKIFKPNCDPKVRMEVPCGKCYSCLQNKRSEWSFRLQQEQKASKTAHFLTLTYDEEHMKHENPEFDEILTMPEMFKNHKLWNNKWKPTLHKPDVQRFLRSLRYEIKKVDHKVNLRYYITGEYGENTHRPHYHGIFFNIPEQNLKNIDLIWKKGFTHVGKVTPASIHYVTGYTIQGQENPNEKVWAMMSRKPGIGDAYLSEQMENYHKNGSIFYVTHPGGQKQKIPRFYSNKLFNRYERNLNTLKNARLQDKKDSKKTARLYRMGNNITEYNEEQIKQKNESIKKRLKTKKL